MNTEKYYSTYYTFMDDINKRCFLYNPKNILIKRFFSHIFYKSLFHCKTFMLIKNNYLNSFPKANIENKQLNYPTKLKNYSNIYQPKLFLKKDYNIFNKNYFYITHDFLINKPPYYEELDNDKKENIKSLIKSNQSDINFYEHRFNINDILDKKDRYFDCELITQQYTYFGYIIIGDNYFYYGTKYEEPIDLKDKNVEEIDINYFSKYGFSKMFKDNKAIKKKSFILFYLDIQCIIKRRSCLMYQSLEVFCKNGKSYFFNLYRKEKCEKVFKLLSAIKEKLTGKEIFVFINENTSEEVKKINNEVKTGFINNFQYLSKINFFASRTFNDLTQYPIFPWLFFDLNKIEDLLNKEKGDIDQVEIINDISSNSDINTDNNETGKIENIKFKKSNEDLSKEFMLRNFNYPICLQTEEKRDNYAAQRFIPHGTNYSTSSYIFYYFVRNYPFLELIIQLQSLHKYMIVMEKTEKHVQNFFPVLIFIAT